mgnify:CR=1 FL=1
MIWAPGTMSHLDMDWENPRRAVFFEKFSKFCRLIRFDKRGTDLSDRPTKMATLEERTAIDGDAQTGLTKDQGVTFAIPIP